MTANGSALSRLLARNMAFNFVGTALPAVVAVALLPVLTRGLGVERFGILALCWLVFTYLTDVGFGRATTKFVADAAARADERGLPAVVAPSVEIQELAGVLVGAALGIVAWQGIDRLLDVSPTLARETRVSFMLVAAGVPFVLLSSAYRGVLEAAQRFDHVNAVRVPSSIANYALPAVGVLAGLGLIPIVAALLVARILTAGAFAWLAVRAEPGAAVVPRLHRDYLRPLLTFGGWVTLGSILTPFLAYGDRATLGALAGAEAVGYYAAPAEVVMRLLIIPGSLAATLFPALSALSAVREATEPTIWRGMKYVMLIVLIPVVVLIAAGEPALVLWLGEDVGRESANVLPVLAVGVAVLSPAYMPMIALQATGRADIPARLYLLEIPLFVGLLVLLIPRWGIVGAAAAWSIRVALDAALQCAAAARIGLITADGARVARMPQAAAAGVVLVIGAFLAAATPGVWGTSLVLAAAMAVAGTTVWAAALDPAERGFVRSWLSARAHLEQTP